tara:strand:+ start:93 stop:377 length:285 start_codon:yes stop_codon:yes gene_type:complete
MKKGETLPGAFWGVFIGGNLLLKIPVFFVESETAINIWLIIWIIYNVFAIFIVFGVANDYQKDKIKINESYKWATISKFASVILFLSAIGNTFF